jgi:hypothetical protein
MGAILWRAWLDLIVEAEAAEEIAEEAATVVIIVAIVASISAVIATTVVVTAFSPGECVELAAVEPDSGAGWTDIHDDDLTAIDLSFSFTHRGLAVGAVHSLVVPPRFSFEST